MAEPFRDLIGPQAVRHLDAALRGAWAAWPDDFVSVAVAGLEGRELKQRVVHVADALRARLPDAWPDAARVLVAALPSALPGEDAVSGMFQLWPVLTVVERHGVEHPDVSLDALEAMTQRFSAEFAIRPLLARWPERVLEVLERWTSHPSAHVRRLVSEGTRSRLPWGMRLKHADPERVIGLLDRLVDDASPYVRRSVANHLGDLAKDDASRALDVSARWLAVDRPERAWIVRHGLRGLLKAGDPRALALMGQAPVAVRVTGLVLAPTRVAVGEPVTLTARLEVDEAADVRVDAVWSWPGARCVRSRRVFCVGTRRIAPGDPWELVYRLSTRPVTTRPTRPGHHEVVLRVQGVDQVPVAFELVEA